MLETIKQKLQELSDSADAEFKQSFYKTEKGGYGEGDTFLGVRVPQMRLIAKEFSLEKVSDMKKLLSSKIHEERFTALLQMCNSFEKAVKEKNEEKKKQLFDLYVKSTKYINNWDLVDVSAHKIVGKFLSEKSQKEIKETLKRLASSENLWEKRIAMVSVWHFAKMGNAGIVLYVANILLNDKHDLIHKAVGWMLRELAKKDYDAVTNFLEKNYKTMPRTMLRYAIERFPEDVRQKYLKGLI